MASLPAARGCQFRHDRPALPSPPPPSVPATSGCQRPRSLTSSFGPARTAAAPLAWRPHRLAVAWPRASGRARHIGSASRRRVRPVGAPPPLPPPPSPFLSPPPLWAGRRGHALTGSPVRCAPPRVGVTAGTGQPSCSAGRASGRRAAPARESGLFAVGSAVLASCTTTSGAGGRG